ncbi:MAG: hypothetical protein SVK08_00270 [Halobacteriota archaeon]|nr:hypothetical protein [Halobacteriota archaeon]
MVIISVLVGTIASMAIVIIVLVIMLFKSSKISNPSEDARRMLIVSDSKFVVEMYYSPPYGGFECRAKEGKIRIIGKGATPTEAYNNMISRTNKALGGE